MQEGTDIHKIDLVVTWVDGSDPHWVKERALFINPEDRIRQSVAGDDRYLDNGLFRYFFRCVENNIRWVNTIHFVTWGHVPSWLNTSHPKLHIVRHEDFIPPEFLPTFNSAAINLNLHRIPGLSERFIYANDDMYFLRPCDEKDFFKNGLPRDMAAQEIIDAANYQDTYYYCLFNDVTLLNKAFNKKEVLRRHFFKWFCPAYGPRHVIKGLLLKRFNLFSGIFEPHIPAPYLRTSFEEGWRLFSSEFSDTCMRKFRSPYNCTENIIRYLQMATGSFSPINREKLGVYMTMSQKALPSVIENQKKKMLCINYSDSSRFPSVERSFAKLLPLPSQFEL